MSHGELFYEQLIFMYDDQNKKTVDSGIDYDKALTKSMMQN